MAYLQWCKMQILLCDLAMTIYKSPFNGLQKLLHFFFFCTNRSQGNKAICLKMLTQYIKSCKCSKQPLIEILTGDIPIWMWNMDVKRQHGSREGPTNIPPALNYADSQWHSLYWKVSDDYYHLNSNLAVNYGDLAHSPCI